MKRHPRPARAALAAAALLLTIAGCGTTAGRTPPAAVTSGGFSVGILLPDTHTKRWAAQDRPLITNKIMELCPACSVQYANADGDVSTQQQQMTSMIENGVRVLVLDPVDYKALRQSVVAAYRAHIPVVSYDRLAEGPISAYSSFDSVQIGRIQAEQLLTALAGRPEPRIVMMNGDPADPNTAALRRGALSVLQGRATISRSYYTAGWIPQNAFTNMSAAIADLGPHAIDGVYSASDGLAFGVVTALKANAVTPLPPVTGQDADLAAVQRLLLGEQYVTVYKPFTSEAAAAAEMAVTLGRGGDAATVGRDRVANDTRTDIPAALGRLVPVTAATIKQTVVKDGLYTAGQICTPKVEQACRKYGLTG